VDEEREPALEPQHEVLPAPLDGHDAVALELLEACGPLAVTSANRSGGVEARDDSEARTTFETVPLSPNSVAATSTIA